MDEIRIDSSDVQKLAATIEHSGKVAITHVAPVVAKGALNIKKDAQERVGRGPYTPGYARSIGYDQKTTPTTSEAEIGPDKDKAQGALGNLLEYEYGTPWSAPTPHLGPALAAEEPKFTKALEDVVLKALGL